ncbi:MAG: TerC family protein [Saprospiraceae bacterium]|nr:TerC family protein [Saprospiraceae bacterium]
MMELLSNPDAWIALLTLCALEIVLGIDNIVFISILTNRLPVDQQPKARRTGLLLAMFMRIGLLLSISWIMQLTAPLFTVLSRDISGRDLILILGGLFLIYKSVKEIHSRVEDMEDGKPDNPKRASYASVIGQILLVDLVFSLDSVITAVGMVDQIEIMVAAVVISVGVMMWSAAPISRFVNRHPAVKVLALAFLIMIGTALVAEGMDIHFPKAYIYFAMAFSVAVEFVNIRLGTRRVS